MAGTEMIQTIGTVKLGKRAQDVLDDLPYDVWKDIQKAPKTSYTKLNSADWRTTPTTRDLAIMASGLLKAREGKHVEVNFINNIHTRWNLPKGYLNGLFEAVRHIQRAEERADAKGGTTNVVGEDSFKQLCNYGLKRLEIESKCDPTLFQMKGDWVELREGAVARLDRDTFEARLNLVTDWRKKIGDGRDHLGVSAPMDVVKQLYAHPDKPVPELVGVAHAPMYTQHGELIATRGFHRASGYYFAPPDDLFVPTPPRKITEADLLAARETLVDILCDFELDGVSRADLEAAVLRGEGERVWHSGNDPLVKSAVPPSFLGVVGFMLEQLVRPMIDGPIMPLLISKTAPRAGGGLLASVIQTVVRGSVSVRPLSMKEEERRKAVISALRSGTSIVVWDNLPERRTVDSPTLATLFTEGTVIDRLLSTNDEVEVDVSCSFMLIGNRPPFSAELTERLNLVELVPQTDKPAERTGWKHASLRAYVAENRGRILGALLVLVKNWLDKGRPSPRYAPTIGRFEEYTRVIGGILEAAGENWTSWQGNRDKLKAVAADDTGDNWMDLLSAWAAERGIGESGKIESHELISIAAEEEIELDVMRIKDSGPFAYNSKSFGAAMRSMVGRVFSLEGHGKVMLERHDKRGDNGFPWVLKPVKDQSKPQSAPVSERLVPQRSLDNKVTVLIGRKLQRLMTPEERAAMCSMSNDERAELKQALEQRAKKAA
ncbi:hypothetical protein [Ruegeria arenilitoris]|uniref:Uncharacterized protein n=1 Tax=Ruegeria arenilitoris TaxID=1173585 RepID=A0A238K2Y6_9RHOB|nr:hypothetical protein [Ruegeria arenilitoris]SMX36482.1 hypothetical protein RUA8715_01414 [Ruegeria arenilitoris]